MVEIMQDQLQALDANIKVAKKMVALGVSLERLRNNGDFKKAIMEGYFEAEAIRLVHLKADPAMQTPERQQSILSQMDAIGNLNNYFTTVLRTADLARKNIDADEATREELLADMGGAE